MLGTSLDASGQSKAAFARELVDLVRRGLGARATSTAQVGAPRLIADGLCYGGIAIIAKLLSLRVGNYVTGTFGHVGSAWIWETALLAVALVLALVGFDRIAAICTLSSFAVVIGVQWRAFGTPRDLLLPDLIVLTVCFAPMLIAPRRRKHNIRHVAWLIVVAPLAAGFYTPRGGLAALFLPVAVALPFALALLPTDPRFAIACSLCAAFVGMLGLALSVQNLPTRLPLPIIVLVLTATPLVLGVAAMRTRSLRRRDPA